MRTLVCGGRDYTDGRRIRQALDAVHASRPITELIHGDCRGADRLAGKWAERRQIPVTPVSAAWDDLDAPGAVIRRNPKTGKFYNRAAGAQRNQRMLEQRPDLVVEFPGDRGTADMAARALKAGIPVMTVDP